MVMRFTKPRRLEDDDELDGFHSGEPALDDWLTRQAKRSLKQGTAVTYISFDERGSLAGFYTLSANSVVRDSVGGGWLARNTPVQIPVILLGRLAVDERCQGNGLGWRLLQDAAGRALSTSRQIGARALIVDSLHDAATRFYTRYGFRPIPGKSADAPARMFLKLA